MKKNNIIISFFLLFFLPFCVEAKTSANLNFEGSFIAKTEEQLTLDVVIQNIEGSPLTLTGGIITLEDTSCFQIESMTALNNAVAFNIENGKFSYMNISGLEQDTNLILLVLKSNKSSCKTKIKIESPKLAFYDKTQLTLETITKELIAVNDDELTLNASNLKLNIGETYQLEMYVPQGFILPPNLITWTSGNSFIASIDHTGKIKANQSGETNMTAVYGFKIMQTKVTVLDYLKGDINGDGKINPLDHYLALRMSLGLNKPTAEELIRGDINNNNRIDAGDVYYILRRSLGLKN